MNNIAKYAIEYEAKVSNTFASYSINGGNRSIKSFMKVDIHLIFQQRLIICSYILPFGRRISHSLKFEQL
jgi:hypothetical protein